MVLEPVWCAVLHANVTRVANLEGEVSSVICPEFQPPATCRAKAAALQGGPLAQLLEHVAEETLQSHGTRCDLAQPE